MAKLSSGAVIRTPTTHTHSMTSWPRPEPRTRGDADVHEVDICSLTMQSQPARDRRIHAAFCRRPNLSVFEVPSWPSTAVVMRDRKLPSDAIIALQCRMSLPMSCKLSMAAFEGLVAHDLYFLTRPLCSPPTHSSWPPCRLLGALIALHTVKRRPAVVQD